MNLIIDINFECIFVKNKNIMIKFLKNKYLITIVLFAVWMFVFDANNIVRQFEYSNEISKLEKERQFYLNEIKENQSTTSDLVSNIDKLEKYAREKYLMKRDNEDIYLVFEEEKGREGKREK